MRTLYNVDFSLSNSHPECPIEILDQTRSFLEAKGLIGIKHVDQIGEIKDGYDKSCKGMRKAFFDIDYRANMTETMPEMIKHLELTSSAYDETAQESIRMAKASLETLSEADPSSVILPWNIYMSLPLISSTEIMTPAGRQSVHYHTKDRGDFGMIQLWKPEKEESWYSLDVFKNLLFSCSFKSSELSLKRFDPRVNHGFFERMRLNRQMKALDGSGKLYLKFMNNPDNIKKIPKSIKKLVDLL